jgi:hypothetical protein
MSVKKEYWENPDNPEDNGYTWICGICGKHSLDSEWPLTHACNLDLLAEMDKWKSHCAAEIDGIGPGYGDDEVVCIWPCGTWCLREDVEEYMRSPCAMSDDYKEVHIDSNEAKQAIGE